MNSTAVVIAIAYAVTVVLGSLVALALARSATQAAETDHLLGVAGVTGWVIGRETAPEPAPVTQGAAPAAGSEEGAAVFNEAGCGSCHTFGPAGSSGAVGPSLDTTTLDAAGVAAVVQNGRAGMPAFAGQLDDEQIAAVAGYVAGG